MAKSSKVVQFQQTEEQRRIQQKCELLDKHSSSEDLFNELSQLIGILSHDESRDDFSVGDDFNFGTDYDVDLLLELISDLRYFTRLNNEDDTKTITTFKLDYLRSYF